MRFSTAPSPALTKSCRSPDLLPRSIRSGTTAVRFAAVVPLLIDLGSKSVDLQLLVSAGDGAVENRIELAVLKGTMETTVGQLRRGFESAFANNGDGRLKKGLESPLARSLETSQPVVESLDDAIRDLSSMVPLEAAKRGATATTAAGDLERSGLTELDRVIDVRIDELTGRKTKVTWLAVLATLLGVYLFIGFFVSVRQSLAGVGLGVGVGVDVGVGLGFGAGAQT